MSYVVRVHIPYPNKCVYRQLNATLANWNKTIHELIDIFVHDIHGIAYVYDHGQDEYWRVQLSSPNVSAVWVSRSLSCSGVVGV
jgi:hypothetical protein